MFFQDSPRLQLGFAGANGCSIPHLSVDGMTPVGPNLSHWPGNRTPGKWKADLSTGIALQFARASATEQEEFLGASEFVLNDHYDTDGFGALLAVLRPEVAIGREELLLTAAAVGDFGTWQTWRGFAIDRTVARIGAPESPVHAVFRSWTDPDQRTLERYRWLIENAESVLDGTGQFAALYAEEMAAVRPRVGVTAPGGAGAGGGGGFDPEAARRNVRQRIGQLKGQIMSATMRPTETQLRRVEESEKALGAAIEAVNAVLPKATALFAKVTAAGVLFDVPKAIKP